MIEKAPAETPGYRLNSSIVLRELHRLLAAFLAIDPIRQHAKAQDDPLLTLHALCTEDEITHLLVSTAISNRLQLEHMQQLRDAEEEASFKSVEGFCGELWPENEQDKSQPLKFRDACNKIIHAKDIEIFDANRPVLSITGSFGQKKQWNAMVELIDYVRLSILNFEDALH